MSNLGMRAAKALQKENGRRLLAREEFLTQGEIADLIDDETSAGLLLDTLRRIVDFPNVETMPGSHLNDERRAQLAFLQIKTVKSLASVAIAKVEE